MEPLTISQFRSAGILPLMTVRCIQAASHCFKVGERYDVCGSELDPGLINEKGRVMTTSSSRFVLDNDDSGDDGGEPDLVKNPAHYARFEIQPLEFCMRNRLEGHVFNMVKYTCRAGHKLYHGKTAEESEVIDLQKVIDFAQKRIRIIKGEPIFEVAE